ncbi:hypothetical protein LP419_39320 [Massilia sp. H-1]|nr:hypothetical protein LP419_39320 [Massilia sp. H-1]
MHEGHQQAVEARLTKADGGAAYLAKFRAVAGQRKGQQEQLSKLVDAIVGAEPTAPEEARTVNPASVRAALALLDAKPTRPAPEPVLRALGLPVGGLNLVARAPVRSPLLTPSYATSSETPSPCGRQRRRSGSAPVRRDRRAGDRTGQRLCAHL